MSNESGVTETKEYVNNVKTHETNDFFNICLLMFLYVMQGIPLGLGAAVPYMLQSDVNTASYQTQATFSIATWPFSLKLAWAPLVDSVYSARIGRRKTWLIPVQYAIGIDLLILANHVDGWLGREPGNPWGPLGVTNPVDIIQLTAAFFGLTMLAATQDIAVDGWALTMLSKKNLGWASTCNSVGQTLGYVIAFILFLSLESPDICNTYLRRVPVEGRGLITFSGFLFFWGVAFLVTTTVVALVKHETGSTLTLPIVHCWERTCMKFNNSSTLRQFRTKFHPLRPRGRAPASNHLVGDEQHSELTTLEFEEDGVESGHRLRVLHSFNHANVTETRELDTVMPNVIEVLPEESTSKPPDMEEQELSLIDTYRVMLGVLRLKPVLQYIGMLFLVKACFSASDSVTGLKLIEHGVPKERMAFLGVVLLPFQAVLPLLITRWTNGPTPLGVYSMAVIPRFLSAALTVPLVYYTPYFRQSSPSLPTDLLNSTLLHNVTTSSANLLHADSTHSFTWTFYGILLAHMGIYSILANFMFVSQMAYHAKISDPVVGGTYMTLLNTAANLASSLPSTILLYLVEPLSIRNCMNADPLTAGMFLANSSNHTQSDLEQVREMGHSWIAQNATCKPTAGVKACQIAGGECVTRLDGFYLEVIFCIAIGLITFPTVMRPLAKRLDALPQSAYSFRLSDVGRCERKRRRRQNSMR